ncbi:polysaccharide pyruvyl transferase family protein [Streptomonospora sp. PA3]|uniref:polysaccharide pyruvyl transferase family protein n=1 Tax=Streptomonospora sp. PA3 TaxID=2607326 RepID=UPI0012DDACF3|nr:polysaccharide pyruvyl transferase family protein [Streptomonospora sp. PA3]MUL42906.1 polysaccharide pyruvyl transferase family protein [Streptomonospora sp. PA3]
MRALVTGWFGFLHGEATAGDVGAAATVSAALDEAGVPHDIGRSPNTRIDGPVLDDLDPEDYDRLIFVCGPAHGWQVRELHTRFAHCHRTAVGVSVVDPADDAVRGFHTVIARDGPVPAPRPDLAAAAPLGPAVPVVGVARAPDQPEYGGRRDHDLLHGELERWLTAKDCARVPLDTRLDVAEWGHCATYPQFDALVRRVDLVVTTRLHGLVLALRNGVPAIAVDPVAGGAKVSAQARALGWPAVAVRDADGDTAAFRDRLDALWDWCRSPAARARTGWAAATARERAPLIDDLLASLPRSGTLSESLQGV